MPECPGCGGTFTAGRALSVHVVRSTDVRCRQARSDTEALLSDSDEEFGPSFASDFPTGGGSFTGDFFGEDYAADDFDFGSDDSDADCCDDSDDDDPVAGDYAAAADAHAANGWEPDRPMQHDQEEDFEMEDAARPSTAPLPEREKRKIAEDRFHETPIIPNNVYAPFNSKLDWEVARWAKLRGAGSTAFTELLKIDGVAQALGLSYQNSVELNSIIDEKLPGRPKFTRSEIVVAGEVFELYSRDIIECIRALFGDTEFAPYLFVVPERHYADKDQTIRLYHNMHTGRWWWSTQKQVEATNPGATIIPILLSSDKTQLTMFGNKSAYPVYMTLGNIPKEIRRKPSRRAFVLLAYLPTSRLTHIKNKAARRRSLANLFHACLSFITEPLQDAGVTGIKIASGDGKLRRGHPIVACYIGDYPEQLLVTCVKTGSCPTGQTTHDHLDLANVLDALDQLESGGTTYMRACTEAGIKPVVHPFWEKLPYTNIFLAITSDVLHQLYQGVVKHLIGWLKTSLGEAELDARCRRLPPNHNIRLFMKGISHLNRVTGREHDQISRFILGIIIDMKLPGGHSPVRLVKAVRGGSRLHLYGQYPMHTTETLIALEAARMLFHRNKDVFVDLGIRDGFNLPKRLHIDLAKDAYHASNRKDEFSQMTLWLERKEKIQRHSQFVDWKFRGSPLPPIIENLNPGIIYERKLSMAKHPTHKSVKFNTLETEYGATFFRDALSRYIVGLTDPELTTKQIERESNSFDVPFNAVPVFQRIKFTAADPYAKEGPSDSIVDSVHVQPSKMAKNGDEIPARFDTVLVNTGNGGKTGTTGYRIAQVRVIFSLADRLARLIFPPNIIPPKHLAYPQPEQHHLMYRISRTIKDSDRFASIIPVDNIRRSIHLFPKFSAVAPVEWKSHNVLDRCPVFFANPWTDRHMYATLY
ncbi:hypothetical protein B0H14DRAFT_3694203 [Mycena olivaceomarginata]|nr:hypothetical protein B0H14DRAFT_3694203 [Mycena olivaceomarginata]